MCHIPNRGRSPRLSLESTLTVASVCIQGLMHLHVHITVEGPRSLPWPLAASICHTCSQSGVETAVSPADSPIDCCKGQRSSYRARRRHPAARNYTCACFTWSYHIPIGAGCALCGTQGCTRMDVALTQCHVRRYVIECRNGSTRCQ